MKRAMYSLIVVTALVLVGLAWRPQVASADASCTVGDFRGTYALSFAPVSNLPGTPNYDAFAGLWTFDGAGHISGRGAGMEHGTFVGAGPAFIGTYEVAPDCGGAIHATVGGTPTEVVFFASNRQERLHFLLLDPGTAGVGTADKQ